MQSPARVHAEQVARTIQGQLGERGGVSALQAQTVVALDVVTHALSFTHSEDALTLWRQALWQQAFPPPTREAVVTMIEHILEQQALGVTDAAAEVCDCLRAVIGPQIGGVHRSPPA